jgi:glycine/D-amino acid oxidase-like deaminating enzyme
MRAHVVVVGGGVMGTSIALELARRLDPIEQPVLLLERRELAAGSSGRSGAILRQHYAQPEVASMARDSLRVWAGFQRSTGYDIGFLRTGVVTLAREPADCERVRRNVEMLRSIGVDTRLMDGDELKRLVRGISFASDAVAAYEPDGGCVDPRRTVEAFASLARYRGATVRIGVEVTDFVVRDGRLAGVETTDGAVQCELAVVAAGPWTNRLLARAGIELPLTVVRPEQHFLAMPAAPKHCRAAPASWLRWCIPGSRAACWRSPFRCRRRIQCCSISSTDTTRAANRRPGAHASEAWTTPSATCSPIPTTSPRT